MTGEQLGGVGAVVDHELRRAHSAGRDGAGVILVEGRSDQRAIEALARRRGRQLDSEGVAVIPIGGATNVWRFLEILGPPGHGVRLAGLCDLGEVGEFRSGLERAGLDVGPDRTGLERLGFFVCVIDLEQELIRALGAEVMLALIESRGDRRRFHSFQHQPAQRDKTIEAQLWRWLGNHKIRYAPLMVDSLDLDRVPRPLEGVLAHA